MFGVPATDDGGHFRLLDRALGVGRSHLELKEQRAFENGTSGTDKRPARRTHGNHAWSYGVDAISPAVSDEEVLPVEGPDRLFGSDAEYAERAEHDRLQEEALANPARRVGTNLSALITKACAAITTQWLDCGAPKLGDFWSKEVWDIPEADDTSRLEEPFTPPPTPDASRLAEKLALDWFQTSGTNWIPAGVKRAAEIEAQRVVITRGYLCTPGPNGLVLIDNDDTDASDTDEVRQRRCQCGFYERNIPEHNGTGFEICICGLNVPTALNPQELVDYVDTPVAMRNLSRWAGETGVLARAAIAANPEKWRVPPPPGGARRRKRALANSPKAAAKAAAKSAADAAAVALADDTGMYLTATPDAGGRHVCAMRESTCSKCSWKGNECSTCGRVAPKHGGPDHICHRKPRKGKATRVPHEHLTRSSGTVSFCPGGDGRQQCLAGPDGMIDFNKPGKWDRRDLVALADIFAPASDGLAAGPMAGALESDNRVAPELQAPAQQTPDDGSAAAISDSEETIPDGLTWTPAN